ncbi:ankyrin repeat domain-containing protein [Persephonella sp.]
MKAVEKGDLELVKKLISKGANVNAKDKGGNTPLHWVARNGHLEIVKYLISCGANKNWDVRTPYDVAKPNVKKYLKKVMNK